MPQLLAGPLGLGVLIGAAWLTFSPAQAAQYTPPTGCELTMTVQSRDCRVTQHYTCAADDPGDQHVLRFDGEGPYYHSQIDAETRWLVSDNLNTGLSDYLVPDSPDHASFSTLIETGRDDFEFWTRDSGGTLLRNVGEDRLTGEVVEIDGVELEMTEYRLNVYGADGELLIQSQGQQFISRAHNRFYGGLERWSDWTGEVRNVNNTPVTFAMPGEPGFGETEPRYDCGMEMVRGTPSDGAAQVIRVRHAQ